MAPAAADYDETMAQEVCARIADGEPLTKVCRDGHLPSIMTVYRWMEDNSEFRESYARARRIQAHAWASEIIELADIPRPGDRIEVKDEAGVVSHKTVTADMVERSKLQVQARQWLVARLHPEMYGDRLAHQMLDEKGKPTKPPGVTLIIDGAPASETKD